MPNDNDTRMKWLGYRKAAELAEPDQLVLVELVFDGRVAIVTINRSHADNAITTELAAQLIEFLETIAARCSHPDRSRRPRVFSGRRLVSAQDEERRGVEFGDVYKEAKLELFTSAWDEGEDQISR